MVIQCPQCQTRFKLADEKVKPSGIKVRCSKCRKIFSVYPPEPEVVPASVQPTEAAAPAPPSSDDLFAAGAFDALDTPPLGESSPTPTVDDAPQKESPALAPSEEQGGDALFEEPNPEQGRDAFEEESEDSFTESASDPWSEAEPSDSSLEEKDPFPQEENDFTWEDVPQEESSAPAPPGEQEAGALFDEPSPEQEQDALVFEEEPSEDGFTESASDQWSEAGPSEYSLEENDPFPQEESDFTWNGEEVGEYDFDESSPPLPADDDDDFSGASFEETPPPSDPEGSLDVETQEPGVPFDRPREEPAPESGGKRAVHPPLPSRRSRPLRTLLLCLLLLLLILGGAFAYLRWTGADVDLSRVSRLVTQFLGSKTQTASTSEIQLKGLTGFFITNRHVGQMFVINGQVVNGSSASRSAIAVKGILYDKAGRALLHQTAYCGNALSEKALHSLPFGKIEDAMGNQFGDSLSNLNVGKGQALAFTIVFKNLPSALAEYTVEVSEAKPGSNQ